MSVARRGSVGLVVAGLVLLGGPAWAQEDPCAPGPDGSVPEMCQSGPAEPTGSGGSEPAAPQEECLGQPAEPGDGVVTDGGDQGIAEGEPNPGAPPSDVDEEPAPEGEVTPEPEPEPAQEEPTLDAPAPGTVSDDGLICAFGGVPVSAPVGGGAPESTAGGGQTAAGGAVPAVQQLPRTGPYDRLLALTALGGGLVLAGAGAAAAGRRRSTG
jgi:hypothetical protein